MLLGKTKQDVDAKNKQDKADAVRAAILAELDALDHRSARALRAVVAGTATEEDKATLAAIEAEAVSKRARLAGTIESGYVSGRGWYATRKTETGKAIPE